MYLKMILRILADSCFYYGLLSCIYSHDIFSKCHTQPNLHSICVVIELTNDTLRTQFHVIFLVYGHI